MQIQTNYITMNNVYEYNSRSSRSPTSTIFTVEKLLDMKL